MNRRLMPLLVVFALVLSVAPSAMADHCQRCVFSPVQQRYVCAYVTSPVIGGWTECYDDEISCNVTGGRCAPHTAAFVSLASEYTVASVERLDDRDKKTDQPQLATADHLR